MGNPKGKTIDLFERLGGIRTVRAVVDDFYERILNDPELFTFFEFVNMSKLKLHQMKFLKTALSQNQGDPSILADKILMAHVRMFTSDGLSEYHFDRVADHLVQSLQACGVKDELLQEVVQVVVPLRQVFANAAKDIREGKDIVKKEEIMQPSEFALPEAAPPNTFLSTKDTSRSLSSRTIGRSLSSRASGRSLFKSASGTERKRGFFKGVFGSKMSLDSDDTVTSLATR